MAAVSMANLDIVVITTEGQKRKIRDREGKKKREKIAGGKKSKTRNRD